jgi:ribonucleoside-diphosphate reductase alpha chain
MGWNECLEPITSNLYKRQTLAGEFVLVNNYLIEDLDRLGLWTKNLHDKIILENGSVQNIDSVPQNLKEKYKTVWEIPQKILIDYAADRGAFICQSQSLNLFVAQPSIGVLNSMHFYAWKKGLKTGCYYLRSKPASNAQKVTVTAEAKAPVVDLEALACSLENPEACVACSS